MNRHWDSLPLTETARGNAQEVIGRLPQFEKVPVETFSFAPNPYRQIVVTRASSGLVTPVGWVSPRYELIQHSEVLGRAVDFVEGIPGASVERVDAMWSPAGERFLAVLDLMGSPVVAPDELPVRLQILCRNSVDGHASADIRLGWFRVICSNGMTAGFSLGKTKLRHRCGASLLQSLERLREQLGLVANDVRTMQTWAATPVTTDQLVSWIDSDVTKCWGVVAAARIWHICNEGCDVAMAPPLERLPATRRRVNLLQPVPGSEEPARNLYAASQALTWVASRRRDIDAAEAASLDVPWLIGRLARAGSVRPRRGAGAANVN